MAAAENPQARPRFVRMAMTISFLPLSHGTSKVMG
jgi:hypothetical protein